MTEETSTTSSEMEPKADNQAAPAPSAETKPTPPPEANAVEMTTLPKAELEKMQRALKDANAEAAKHRKAIQAIEAEEQAKKEANLSEMERLQKQLERASEQINQLNAQIQARELLDLKVSIAKKIGLPEAFANRLMGDTEDDLERDAKEILAALPKPAAVEPPSKKNPGLVAANPGTNGQPGTETDGQKFARLMGSQNVAFDIDHARRRGGGVVFSEPSGSKE